ncbi:oxidoreductase family protein [Salix suchowensis]|nr:oxidoreductase family protein [Salix suchowensis]
MAPILAVSFNDSSNITDFFLNKGNGVKGLPEMGLESLPKENIQPLEERKCDTKSCSQNPFPSLACQNGMTLKFLKQSVKLQGNGDSFRLLTIEYLRMLRKQLISSSGYHLRRRGKYPKELSPSNNVRFGSNFSPEAEKALEWKDYLSFMSPRMRLLRCGLLNQKLLSLKLLDVLMKNLNVTEMDETKESLLLGSKRINLNYYPICPDPELTVGVGRYSDVSTLTVLLQRDIGGLYVRRDNDSWIHVPLANGSIVINVGDALQIMSNGRYMSIEHCVIANGSDNRISVPIFINPRPSDKIFLFLKHCPAERRPCIMKFCTGIMPSISSEKHLMGRKTTDVAKIWCHLF